MSETTLAKELEEAVIHKAVGAFSAWLEEGSLPSEVVSPVAHPMNQGIDGHSGHIAGINGEALFLKVLSSDQERWVGFENAVEIARNAGNAGLSPRLIASDLAAKALLFEGMDKNWRTAIVLDLRAHEVRRDILVATRKLHDLAPVSNSVSIFARIAEMRQHMETGTRHVVSGIKSKVTHPETFSEMCAVVDRIGLGFEAADSDLCPCHVENSLSNFLLGPSDSVMIVDFDRAANADPLSDVGALCNEFCRTDQDIAQAVEMYSGRCDAASLARVKLHMILSAFYWGMWGRISHFSSCRPGIEYYKYGENQFIRCAYHMANWDIEQLIREM